MKNNKQQPKNVISFLPTGDFYYTKAMDAMLFGQVEKARKYLLRAVELDPKDAKSYLQLGILALEVENYHEAYDFVAKAHMLDASNTEAIFCDLKSLAKVANVYASCILFLAFEIIAFISFGA